MLGNACYLVLNLLPTSREDVFFSVLLALGATCSREDQPWFILSRTVEFRADGLCSSPKQNHLFLRPKSTVIDAGRGQEKRGVCVSVHTQLEQSYFSLGTSCFYSI